MWGFIVYSNKKLRYHWGIRFSRMSDRVTGLDLPFTIFHIILGLMETLNQTMKTVEMMADILEETICPYFPEFKQQVCWIFWILFFIL